MKNTYWNSNGRYQELADQLQALIPVQGAVRDAKRNPALEKYRRAVNCYYDLYNNGLCNRVAEFRKVFGIASSNFKFGFGEYSSTMYDLVEAATDAIILAAAEEQNKRLTSR